mmetsp:Transcript_15254/g.18003  ORF Transcript_15254/g.18003 Transcript_15254/m.18003 type:complete len:105 (-) Transcript_15254:5-319(-)
MILNLIQIFLLMLVTVTRRLASKGTTVFFTNNTCVFRGSYFGGCNADYSLNISNNKVSSKNGDLSVCGMNFSEWQAKGNDRKTTLRRWPTDVQLVQLSRELLSF